MPKSHPPYSPEFRRQIVGLVRAGRSSEDLAREFKPTVQSIGSGVAQAGAGPHSLLVAGLRHEA